MATQELDIEEFIVPAHDASGRSVRVYFRIPPLMGSVLSDVMSSGKFPFQTKEDVCRWSLYQGIKALEAKEHFSGAVPILDIMVLLVRARWPLQTLDEFFAKLDRAILELLTSGYQEKRARRLVRAIQELILCMPSSADRGLYLSELRRRWAHLLVEPELERADSEPENAHRE